MIRTNGFQIALLIVIYLLPLLIDKAIVLKLDLLLYYLSVPSPYAIRYGLHISGIALVII